MFPVTASRRPHRKTKTGCAVCKRRKVKCDETRPSCKNCINYGEACVYVPIRPRKAPSSSSTSSALQNAHSNTESPQSTHSEIGTSISNFSQSNNQNNCQNRPSTETDLNLRDLELLHNFYTSTYATIHHDRALQTLWRTNVAHLGISHPFVMHAILAFSALHLAHFTPTADKRHFYIQQAMTHHEKGLQIATSAMFVLTKDSCTPLFLFSVLTCIFALARPRRPDDFILVGETGLSEWLLILRGSGSIIDFAEPQLRAGPLGPLFNAGTRRDRYRNTLSLEAESIEAFSYLKELSDRISTSPLSFREREIYRLSLEEIRSPLAVIYGQEVETFESGDVFVWVLKVPKEFLLLLKEHTQEALAIFSLFAVIVKPLETNWWIEGLSHHLISRIYELVDAEHKDWIQWPIHQLGWIPPHLEPDSHGHAHAYSHGSTSGRFDGHGSLASRVHSHSHSQDTRDGMSISHDGYTPESSGYTSGVGAGGVGGSAGGNVGGSGIQPQVDSRGMYDPRLQNCEPGRTEYLDERNNRDPYEGGHGGSVIG